MWIFPDASVQALPSFSAVAVPPIYMLLLECLLLLAFLFCAPAVDCLLAVLLHGSFLKEKTSQHSGCFQSKLVRVK